LLLQARQFQFTFPRPTLVMGVVNVTPDSFWEGARFPDPTRAVDRAVELVEQGADLIDVGGESTRPGSVPVSEAEELRRVLPALEKIAGKIKVPISVDTMKAGVAREALARGASIINDVGANRTDPELWQVVAGSGAGYVCMHMQGTPRTMQQAPAYQAVVSEVETFFRERLERLQEQGVQKDHVIFDPGIGFGKKIDHNLELLGALGRFAQLDRPLLLGVSRKSFLGKFSGAHAEQRLAAGLACACLAVAAGVGLIRTHDVAETVRAARMTEAILAQQAK
jgi:dihydropteroate synthase